MKSSMEVFVVDLDHSLIKTDLLHEQVLWLMKNKPFELMRIPLWLLKGKAFLKSRLSKVAVLQPDCLPYREELVEEIRQRRANGQITVLASASHIELLNPIGAYLGIFDEIIGTNDSSNLKGRAKLEQLQLRYPERDFVYVGDSSSDYEIWKHSSAVVAVNPSAGLKRKLSRLQQPKSFIFDRKPYWRSVLKALRAHQWSKNILVFLPLIGSHKFEAPIFLSAFICLASFSMIASSVYVLNDLLDLESDRRHRTKRDRPFASGSLTVPQGFFIVGALWSIAILLCLSLPLEFSAVLGLYLVLNAFYSLKLKSILVIDVVLLASMYTIRILAGGAATGIPVSHWLLAFSTFLFFGLALAKRATELVKATEKTSIAGRGYDSTDRETLLALGSASSLIAVLVLVLYLNSANVIALYSHPIRLWLIAPICLWWIGRVWILTMRGLLHDDPVIFALKDRQSQIAGALFGLSLYSAI